MSTQRDEGLAALQAGRSADAVPLLEEAWRAAPADLNTIQYLAAAYQQSGRHRDAANTQISAVNLQPSNPQARYNLGVILRAGGYLDEARQAFEQALQLQPDYPQAADALKMVSSSAPPTPSAMPQPPAPMQTPSAIPQPPPQTSTHYGMPQPPAPMQTPYGMAQTPAPMQTPYGRPEPPVYGTPHAGPTYPQPAPPVYPANTGASSYGAGAVPHGYAAPVQAAQALRCQACGGTGSLREVSYNQNIGLLVMRLSKRIGGRMCERCAAKYFWQFTLTTLALGWFGIISFFVSPFLIIGNVVSFAKGASAGQKILAFAVLALYIVLFIGLLWLFITSRSSRSSEY